VATTVEFSLEFRNKRYNSAADGLKALAKQLSKAPDVAVEPLKKSLKEYVEAVAEALARRHGNAWPGGTTPTTLSRRSGKLIDEIRKSAKVYGDSLATVAAEIGGGNARYAGIQEYGGVVTPKKASYLTIPLKAALNADGTPKKQSAREWLNTFVIKSKAGNLLIVMRDGPNLVPLYVLKSQVKIPPRLRMGETVRAGMGAFVDEASKAMYDAIMGV
jgi:phage gpG-like protein